MSMKTIGLVAIVAMLGIVGMVVAQDDSGDGWSADGAQAVLVMTANHAGATIENVGTDYASIGGLYLAVDGQNVANLPWTVILRPEPFTYTKGNQNDNYKAFVAVNLTAGNTVVLTNGVGTYASCVVA